MKKIISLFTIVLIAALTANALVVKSTSGNLSSLVEAPGTVKSLTVSGTVDARDFLFINKHMEALEVLDMGMAAITPWSDDNNPPFAITSTYDEQTIPPTAFAGTKLTSIVMPNNLRGIGYGAFAGCKDLKELNLPSSVETIGDQAFNGCTSLRSVSLPSSVYSLGTGAFAHCTALGTVTITPVNAMRLGDEAFLGCTALHRATIGPNVEAIGARTFAGCTALRTIGLSKGTLLAVIGDGAFQNSALDEFDFTVASQVDSIGEWTFAGTSLSEVRLPSNLRHLEDGALAATPELTLVVLPKSLTYAAPYLLAESAATDVHINTSSVSAIEDYALYNTGAAEIELPGRVNYLGTQAMAGATSVATIKALPINPPELGSEVWAGVKQSNVELKVNRSQADDYRAAAQWQDFMLGDLKLLGDVNADGNVDLIDADDMELFVATDNQSRIDIDNADVNGDGKHDIADVVAIFNVLLDRPILRPAKRTEENDENLAAADFELEDYEDHEMEVELHNIRDYTAFQFLLTVPEGLELRDITIGDRAPGHILNCIRKADGIYSVTAHSGFNEEIDNADAPLMKVTVAAKGRWEDDMKLDIVFSDVTMATAEENVFLLPDLNVVVTASTAIKGVRTEVDGVGTTQNDIVDVYNTQGQLLRKQVRIENATQGLPQGIYIVGNKKVMVR